MAFLLQLRFSIATRVFHVGTSLRAMYVPPLLFTKATYWLISDIVRPYQAGLRLTKYPVSPHPFSGTFHREGEDWSHYHRVTG
ncbi:hypothetical protein AVEN_231863-1 [Araneus ventricosus]|uniref:Uncharacterized protein n=1 Tax=Araneus ventricosus TaxID=182803 RepID=A0A4Y2UIP8_ARAVE|nr:hypothetical protein AVEN_231863-1 [Araneus ventricosus]